MLVFFTKMYAKRFRTQSIIVYSVFQSLSHQLT
jgi:hypothetical protein